MSLPAIAGVFFRLGTDQVDCRADKTGAHSAPRKNRLVFIDDFLVMSHVNVPLSIQSPQQMGTGHKRLRPGVPECGDAATSTEVSTTPLGRFFLKLSNYGDLRCLPSLRSIEFNLIQDFAFRYALQVVGCLLESAGDLFLPTLEAFRLSLCEEIPKLEAALPALPPAPGAEFRS